MRYSYMRCDDIVMLNVMWDAVTWDVIVDIVVWNVIWDTVTWDVMTL